MKRQNILKEAGVLLITAVMISSMVATADTATKVIPKDVDCKEVWLGYESDNPCPLTADVWLGFDDGNAKWTMGSVNPPIWYAIRMDNLELGPYDGWKIEEIRWYEYYTSPDIYPSHTVYYIIAEGNAMAPITEMINESETTTNVSGWKNYNFMTTYTIDASTDLWIIVWVSDAGPFPHDNPGCYDGNSASYVANKSAMFDDAADSYPTFIDIGTGIAGAWLINVRIVEPPEPILSISVAGGLGLTATITNNGDADANNVNVNIKLEGGFIIFDQDTTWNIGTIAASGGTGVARSLPIGISLPATVNITVTCDELVEVKKSESHYLLLFFII